MRRALPALLKLDRYERREAAALDRAMRELIRCEGTSDAEPRRLGPRAGAAARRAKKK